MNEQEVRSKAIIGELEAHRNLFASRCVELQAELAVVNARNAELHQQIVEMTKKNNEE